MELALSPGPLVLATLAHGTPGDGAAGYPFLLPQESLGGNAREIVAKMNVHMHGAKHIVPMPPPEQFLLTTPSPEVTQ